MGLFNKLKNVLFEEEEVEIPILTKTEAKPKAETQIKKENLEKKSQDEERVQSEINDNLGLRNIKRDIEVEFEELETKTHRDLEEEKKGTEEVIKEKESPFLSFDEDEFEKFNPRIIKNEALKENKKNQNSKKEEDLKENKEEHKKFRPSPVISPVYGILDKNYKKEDIVERNDNFNLVNEDVNVINVDSVRKKAFGTLEDDIETTLNSVEKEITLENANEEEKNIDEILNDLIDDTIDDALTDNEVSNIDNEQGIFKDKEKVVAYEEANDILEDVKNDIPSFEEMTNKQQDEAINPEADDILEKTNTLKMLDDIEKELNDFNNKKEDNDLVLEDTRETDLFNLIDSMYENKDEEENEE